MECDECGYTVVGDDEMTSQQMMQYHLWWAHGIEIMEAEHEVQELR